MIAEHVHNALREAHDARLLQPEAAGRCSRELKQLQDHLRAAYDLSQQLGFTVQVPAHDDGDERFLAALEVAA